MLYTILDIETTGLNRINDEILEVGYMQINKKLEIVRSGVFYFYKPEWKIETPAQRIHGLTREFLSQHEDKFNGNIVRLYTLFANGVILGKNSNGFDIPFIQAFFNKYASPIAPVACRATLDLEEYYTPRYRDWYLKNFGVSTRGKGKLGELVHMIGFTDEQVKERFTKEVGADRAHAHGALYDVFMTYLLVEYAVNNYGMKI